MVNERIILAIANALHHRACTTDRTLDLNSGNAPANPLTKPAKYENALPTNDLYETLLLSYDVNDIQGALLWMKLRGYLGAFGWGVGAPEMGYQLTEKGVALATSRKMPRENLQRLSGKTVSVKPAIYGISLDLKEIWWRVRKAFRTSRGGRTK